MSATEFPRAIIQLDIDYFYAQAEEVLDPTLRHLPVAIQQKHIVVTCNYVARSYGIGKLELLTEAKKKCRDLRIIDGSDITRYRRYSRQIFELVKYLLNGEAAADETGARWTVKIERLGFDELFMDVTELIRNHLRDMEPAWPDGQVIFQLPKSAEGEELAGHWASGFTYTPGTWAGHTIANLTGEEDTQAALQIHYIQIASHLANHIRMTIRAITGFTTSAGTAHNKLFAKLAASAHKPNDQTALLSGNAASAFLDAMDVRKIAGFGSAVRKVLMQRVPELEREAEEASFHEPEDVAEDGGGEVADIERDGQVLHMVSAESTSVEKETNQSEEEAMAAWRFSRTVADLRRIVPESLWKEWFGPVIGQRCFELLNGIDNTPVSPTTWPAQIGVEDAFRHCSTFEEARGMLLRLATMLVERVQEEEYLEEKRRWRRVVKQLRLTVRRRRKGNERSWFDDRESKTILAPVEMHDTELPIPTRATMLVDNTIFPLFKRIVSSPPKDIPWKDMLTPGDGFDLTLLNITASDLRKEGVGRSIREFFSAAAQGEIEDEGERQARTLARLGIDQSVFEELPEEIRREILAGSGGDNGMRIEGGSKQPDSRPVASTSKRKQSGQSQGESSKRSKSSIGPLDKLWRGRVKEAIPQVEQGEGPRMADASSKEGNDGEGQSVDTEQLLCNACGASLFPWAEVLI
ncbi:hypothetical protein HDV00_003171 [Rhizophlyctis rosea]|nr:hypothetical protein HDV00_003171 [Rhizophlyctis rosea]